MKFELEAFLGIFLLNLLESRLFSLSCSSAEESESGHKDDDHGMLIDLFR